MVDQHAADYHQTDRILSSAEVAEMFRVDPKTVIRWANIGKLPHFRTLGGHRRFYLSDVQRAMKEQNP